MDGTMMRWPSHNESRAAVGFRLREPFRSKTMVLLLTALVTILPLAALSEHHFAGLRGEEGRPLPVSVIGPSSGSGLVGYWKNVSPAYGPDVDWGAAITYVPELGTSLLFGGHVDSAFLNETWAYNASRSNWTRLAPSSPAPAVRLGEAMVYDTDVGKVVLFGGLSLYGNALCARNDTWLYDPGTNTWENVTPQGSPPLRTYHSMVYDPLTRHVVLFGGLEMDCGFRIPEYDGPKLNDTWAYDARANTWTNVSSSVAPAARYAAGLSFDPARGSIVLFGGAPIQQGYPGSWVLGDTWLLDSKSYTWRQVYPSATPPARYGHGMAYDAMAHAGLLYGGCGIGACYNDTWWYNGTTGDWTVMPSRHAPDFSPSQSLAYDLGGVLVVFGRHETWEYRVVRALAASISANPTTSATVAFLSEVSGGAPPYEYAWAFGDGASSVEANPSHTYSARGDYEVTLTVTDATGASAADSLHLSMPTPAALPAWIPYSMTAAVVLAGVIVGVYWRRRVRRSRLGDR